MGAWGLAPWDDDSGADWFGDLFDEFPIADKVEQTLNLDPEQYAAEIRTAASMLVMLGRTYVWPIDHIDRHLALAIERMLLVREFYDDEPDFASAVDAEIAILKSRQENSKDAPMASAPAAWANFWA